VTHITLVQKFKQIYTAHQYVLSTRLITQNIILNHFSNNKGT